MSVLAESLRSTLPHFSIDQALDLKEFSRESQSVFPGSDESEQDER